MRKGLGVVVGLALVFFAGCGNKESAEFRAVFEFIPGNGISPLSGGSEFMSKPAKIDLAKIRVILTSESALEHVAEKQGLQDQFGCSSLGETVTKLRKLVTVSPLAGGALTEVKVRAQGLELAKAIALGIGRAWEQLEREREAGLLSSYQLPLEKELARLESRLEQSSHHLSKLMETSNIVGPQTGGSSHVEERRLQLERHLTDIEIDISALRNRHAVLSQLDDAPAGELKEAEIELNVREKDLAAIELMLENTNRSVTEYNRSLLSYKSVRSDIERLSELKSRLRQQLEESQLRLNLGPGSGQAVRCLGPTLVVH